MFKLIQRLRRVQTSAKHSKIPSPFLLLLVNLIIASNNIILSFTRIYMLNEKKAWKSKDKSFWDGSEAFSVTGCWWRKVNFLNLIKSSSYSFTDLNSKLKESELLKSFFKRKINFFCPLTRKSNKGICFLRNEKKVCKLWPTSVKSPHFLQPHGKKRITKKERN